MSSTARLKASIEAVSFSDGGFFQDLTAAFQTVMDIAPTANTNAVIIKAALNCGFVEIVKKHTNITIVPKIDESYDINAYVFPPTIDPNHPLIYDWWKGMLGSKDGLDVIKKTKSPLQYTIDRDKGRVTGHLADLKVKVGLHLGVFLDPNFKADNLAAILLHEIGHIFAYYEFIGYTYRTNAIMHHTTQTFFGTQDLKTRTVVLDSYNKSMGLDNATDDKKLVTINDEKQLITLLLSKKITQTQSSIAGSVYDLRSFEQLADDYATRQGAGRALAVGLDEMYKQGLSRERNSTLHWLTMIMEVVSLSAIYLSPFVGIVTTLLLLLGSDPNGKIYDDPLERLQNIRKQSIEGLKSAKTPDLKAMYLADIRTIESLERSYNGSNKGLHELIWRNLIPSRRKAYNAIKFQKELEALVSNPLYASAAELTTLGT